MLHPVVVLKNGRMKIKKIYVGRRKTAWKKYIASTFNKELHMDKKMLFITYAGLTNDELKEITKEVREKDAIENIIYQKHLRRLPLTADLVPLECYLQRWMMNKTYEVIAR